MNPKGATRHTKDILPGLSIGYRHQFKKTFLADERVGNIGPFELLYDKATSFPIIRDPHTGLEARLNMEPTLRAAAEQLARVCRAEVAKSQKAANEANKIASAANKKIILP